MNVQISTRVEDYVFVTTPGFAFDLPLRYLGVMFYSAFLTRAALLTLFFLHLPLSFYGFSGV